MQIVIDMTEHEYEVALKNGWSHGFYSEKIKNGTPLPKGHGRLIDADALFDEYSEIPVPAYIIEPYINAPIIIEADKEVGE